MEKSPVRHQRSHSTSNLLETTAKGQFLSVNSAGNNHSPGVLRKTPKNEETSSKAYPIPPRRTKKFTKYRSQSTSVSCSTLYSLEEDGCPSVNDKAQETSATVLKRPLREQYSNPELSRGRVKPPRPPPPVRLVPPRTFTQMDRTQLRHDGKRSTAADKTPVIIDTRARRRQHSDSSQPKRPPLPYETFVHQPPDLRNESKNEATSEPNITPHEKQLTVAPPADYEVAVTITATGDSSRYSSSSENSNNISTGNMELKMKSQLPAKKKEQDSSSVELSKEKNSFSGKTKERMTDQLRPSEEEDTFRETKEEISVMKYEQVPRSKSDLTKNDKVESDNEQESDLYQYAALYDPDWKEEEDAGCEPIYIEMNPSVYIPPPKDYRPKKRTKVKRDNCKR